MFAVEEADTDVCRISMPPHEEMPRVQDQYILYVLLVDYDLDSMACDE